MSTLTSSFVDQVHGQVERLMRRLAVALLFTFGLLPCAMALPMGSQGSWMLMADNTPDSRELALNYALTRDDALGLAIGRWEEMPHAGAPRKHALRREFAGLTYTRLLHRWNLPHAQANLWLLGAAGTARAQEHQGSDGMGSVSFLADYETTWVYTAAGVETMRTSRLRHDTRYVRAGFSFYEVEYEEVQPWLILELKQERFRIQTKNSFTPMLRLIHRRYFVELGGNRDGASLNFMLNY
jgi:hypothetical protein